MQSLEGTVESCVNRVGVDLNTASHSLLRYVAALLKGRRHKIVEYRNEARQISLARRAFGRARIRTENI